MNNVFLINAILTTGLAVGGWIVAHYFTSKRDLRNKRLEIRTRYLIELYHQLDTSISRKITPKRLCDLEDVLCFLQLFSNSKDEIEAIIKAGIALGGDGDDIDVSNLEKILMNTIRKEMGLKDHDGPIAHLRLTFEGEDPRNLLCI